MERPEVVTDELLDYLDDLRESGVTNMYAASIYLQEVYGFNKGDASDILRYWMFQFKGK